ncbi:ATP-dependent RNA helicase DDX1, partial [Clonorchis sinensis]
TPLNENVSIGVYHSGILVYRGRIRIGRFPWLQLVKLSHKSKTFSITIRAVNIDPRIRVAFLLKPTTGVLGTRKKATNHDDDLYQLCTLNCQCADARLAKRLWESCASQHAFFRLRDSPTPQRPNLTTLFNSRKYHYPDKGICGSGTVFPSSDPTKRKQPRINRVQTQRKPAQFASDGVAPVAYSEDPDQFYILPGSPSPLPADAVNVNVLQNLPPAYKRPGATRVPLAQEYWRMSPADCTPGLGMNSDGTDVAAMANTDWQGCRCNRGVKWPGAYFFEAIMIEEGSVRLGWSTNNANLILGTDSNGFGYGVDQDDPKKLIRPNPSGLLFHGNVPEQYGLNVSPGDCIGCYLELDSDGKRLCAQWSHNGQLLGPAPLRKPCSISVNDSLFPAASLKDARVAFNFGYRPFRFPPTHYSTSGAPWVPVANTPEVSRVGNRNVGWRVNPADVSSSTNLLISPNGRMVQAVANTGWQGFRVNKGICGGGKYYYEVKVMEDSGLARIGWSLDGANLDLGYDAFGYGFGADRDGFGITGHQGKKLHGDVIENYGEAFGKDDVIGCFLDLDTGVVQWSKNGRLFGSAYWLPEQFLKQGDPIFPAASLVDTTLELNYGDLPFEFPPETDWLPLFAAPDENVVESSTWQNLRAVERQEKELHKSYLRMEHQRACPEPPRRTSSRIPQTAANGIAKAIRMQRNGDSNHLGWTDPATSGWTQEDEVHSFTGKDLDDLSADDVEPIPVSPNGPAEHNADPRVIAEINGGGASLDADKRRAFSILSPRSNMNDYFSSSFNDTFTYECDERAVLITNTDNLEFSPDFLNVGKQAPFAETLLPLSIDVCCVSETRTQDPTSVVHLKPFKPSLNFPHFTFRVCDNPEEVARYTYESYWKCTVMLKTKISWSLNGSELNQLYLQLEWNTNTSPLSTTEIQREISPLQHNQAHGQDDLHPALVEGGDVLKDNLTTMLRNNWNETSSIRDLHHNPSFQKRRKNIMRKPVWHHPDSRDIYGALRKFFTQEFKRKIHSEQNTSSQYFHLIALEVVDENVVTQM